MKRLVLRYGLISGIIMAGAFCIGAAFNVSLTYGWIIGYTSMVLGFSLIYFAIQTLKKEQGGYISFWQALKTGLLISLIGSAIYGLTWVILYNTVMSDFVAKYSASVVAGMKKAGKSAEEINKTLAEIQGYKKIYDNPLTNFLFTAAMEPLPVGVVVSLIAALVGFKRKKPATA